MTAKQMVLRYTGVVVLLGWSMSPPAQGGSVLAGTDYLTTSSALFDFGAPIGPVALIGAFGPGVADTAVTRLDDAILPAIGSSDTVSIQMRMLELRSLAPVFVGGSFFDVFVHLDPSLFSTGTLTITHEFPDNGTPAPEGTFTSSLTVHFVADFIPAGPGSAFSVTDTLLLNTPGPLPWSHEPPPGALSVPGTPGDLDANVHAPLPPGFSDFFPLLVIEQHPGVGIHVAELASQRGPGELQPVVPEPGSFLLLLSGTGLVALQTWRRKRTG